MISAQHRTVARASSQPSSWPKAEFNPTTYVRRLLGENAAIVWERIRWWVDHNKKQGCGSHYRNGYWWSWNSYERWIQDKEIAKHSLTRRQFQTAIQRLKGTGLIVVERHRAEGKLFGFYRTIDPVGCGVIQQTQAEQPAVREPDAKVMNMAHPAFRTSDLHSKKSWTRSGRDLDMCPIYIQSNSLPPYHSGPETSDVHKPPCKKNLEKQASNILKDVNSELPACSSFEREKNEKVSSAHETSLAPKIVSAAKKSSDPIGCELWETMMAVGRESGLTKSELRSLYITAKARGYRAHEFEGALAMAQAKGAHSLGAMLHRILQEDEPTDMANRGKVLKAKGRYLEKQLVEIRNWVERLNAWFTYIDKYDSFLKERLYRIHFAEAKPTQNGKLRVPTVIGATLYYPDGCRPTCINLKRDSTLRANDALKAWKTAIIASYNVVEDDACDEPCGFVAWRQFKKDVNHGDADFQRLTTYAELNAEYWSGGGRDLTDRFAGSVGECYPDIAAHPAYLWCTKTGIRAHAWDRPEDFQRKVQQMAQAYDGLEFVGKPKFIMPQQAATTEAEL